MHRLASTTSATWATKGYASIGPNVLFLMASMLPQQPGGPAGRSDVFLGNKVGVKAAV